MIQASRTLFLTSLATLILVTAIYGQDQKGRPGGPKVGPAKDGRVAGFEALPTPIPPEPLIPDAKPLRSCESLATVSLLNTTIESAAVDPKNPGICRVKAHTTHSPMGDEVNIWVGIPLSNWNGRFMGTGGGGFMGGSEWGINQPLAQGYAAGATDTGYQGGSGSFALNADGRLNWQLIRDNGHMGIHEMTLTGKALTEAMFGVAPKYSYFNGCSTGSRQGLMEAQKYPQDQRYHVGITGNKLEPAPPATALGRHAHERGR